MPFKKYLTIACLLLATINVFGQTGTIKGNVKDASNGDPLIGATVLIGPGKGTVTDIDGNFSIQAEYGDYQVKVSYIGFDAFEQKVSLRKPSVTIGFGLEATLMKEVVITTDVARTRETPVAFTTIATQKIEEELGARDVPMLLNSVAGVQATAQGGSDGDIKVTIRGFAQRNVAVLIDGVPVNDMENGAVYWSNWTGLDLVTRTVQVQRGLGSSKLAVPSVGGSINILSKGIEAKQALVIGQEAGSFGYSRTSISYTSGKLKGGWGITAAGSFRRKDGWADQTSTIGGFYFLKVEKAIKDKHILTFWASGTPQQHGERPYTMPVAVYDTKYANSIGINTSDYTDAGGTIKYATGINRGLRYNSYWGNLDRYVVQVSGDTIHGKNEAVRTSVNNYQKPQFNLKYTYAINPKLFWNTTAYMSIGRGGGVKFLRSPASSDYDPDGQVDVQHFYDVNKYNQFNPKRKADNYLTRANNDHMWYGALSNINYQINKTFTINGGIDIRDYSGRHYNTVYDLLGADYAEEARDVNGTPGRREGDIVIKNYESHVRWAGAYTQLEVTKNKWTAFLGITGSYNGYKQTDYFKAKQLTVGDTVLNIALKDTINYNGQTYTQASKGVHYAQTDWKWLPGYTFKAGVSYKITDNHSVFLNAGYLSRAPYISNVIDGALNFYKDIKNELVESVELGYSAHYAKWNVNLSGYYMEWKNRPVSSGVGIIIDDVTYRTNINGMNARHMGLELEANYNPIKQLQLEGVVSYGDWKWTSGSTVYFTDDNGNPVIDPSTNAQQSLSFNAKGVHVGDAPQAQLVLGVRYEPIKGLYFKVRGTYFMKYYSQFDPLTLQGTDAGRDSWQIPNYGTFDLFVGYKYAINKKHRLDFSVAVLNFTNKKFISDARNNDTSVSGYHDFDAKSASVFFGMPINFSVGVKYTFN